jgi:hypothetical protein
MNRQCVSIVLLALFFVGFTKQVLAQAVWIPGWQQTSEMNSARAGASILQVNGVIYAIGGINGRDFLNTTEYSKINPDGTLGPWQPSAILNDARGFFDAVEHNGFIYTVGGGKGENGKILLRSVERSRITDSGALEGWVTERYRLQYPRRCVKLFVANERLYALGGFAGTLLDSVESAAINKDGSLGRWQVETNPLTMTRYINSVKSLNAFVYAIGGHAESEGVGLTEVEFTQPSVGSELVWKKTSAMQAPRYGLSSAANGQQLYALGGLNGAAYTDKIELTQQQANGELAEWRYTTPLSSVRANFGSVVVNNRIYIIGGTNRDGYYKTAEYASLDERGDIGFWGSQQQLESYQQQQQAKLSKPKRKLPNSGLVAEVIQTKAYSYIRVAKGVTEQWIAGSRAEFNVGDPVEYSRGTTMANFHSSTLNRTFDSIIFVESLRPGDEH